MAMTREDIDEKIRSHHLWLRQKSGGRRADFSNAEMKGCELVDIVLVRAKLLGANVSCSKLNGINLSESDLYSADFSYSDLLGANLSSADMRGTKLREANLTGANLDSTDMREGALMSYEKGKGEFAATSTNAYSTRRSCATRTSRAPTCQARRFRTPT